MTLKGISTVRIPIQIFRTAKLREKPFLPPHIKISVSKSILGLQG